MATTAQDVKKLREKTGAGMLDCKKALDEANGNFEEAETILKKMGLAAVAKRSDRSTEQGRIFSAMNDTHAVILELGCETDFVARNEDFVKTGQSMAQLALSKGLNIDSEELKTMVTEIAAVIKENITIRRMETFTLDQNTAADTYIHGDAGSIGVVVLFSLSNGELKNLAPIRNFMHDCALHAAAFKPEFLNQSKVSEAFKIKQREIFQAQIDGDEKNASKPEQVKANMLEGKLKKLLSEICFTEQAFVKDDKKTVAEMAEFLGKANNGSLTLVDYRVYRAGEALA